jgi:Ser/Thr protein kinase RdoA (MazF antagonist)
MKGYMFEGTAQEVIEAMTAMQAASSSDTSSETAAAVAPTVAEEGEEKEFVSTEVARRVLSRRPLSREQLGILKMLHAAYPGWVPAAKLQAAISYTPAQFAGMMGAFGRRFSHTEGFVENTWLFDAEWDYEVGAYNYRLPETVKVAMDAEKLA